jgi:hypothetical protein
MFTILKHEIARTGYALRFLNRETESFALVSVKPQSLANFSICALEAAPAQHTDAASPV